MDLPKVISSISQKFQTKAAPVESFLALKISSTSVVATVWTVSDGKVSIGPVGSGLITKEGWEQLLTAADKAVTDALASNPEDVSKVVYALPAHWVAEGKILPDHLKDLRRLSKELDLVPLGFVSLTEALENFYKEVEGAPLTAILVGIDGANSTLTVYRAGKNLGLALIDLSGGVENFASVLESHLRKFNETDILPSRIILYDGKSDLSRTADRLTAHPWTQKLPFLHFPKVETLGAESVVKAVAVAGGKEQGGHFDQSEELLSESPSLPKDSPPSPPSEDLDLHPIENEETREGLEEAELAEVTPAEAGFVADDEFREMAFPSPQLPLAGQFREMPASETLEKSAPLPSKVPLKLPSLPQVKLKVLLARLSSFFPSSSTSKKRLPPLLPLAGAVVTIVIFLFGLSLYFLQKADVILTVAAKPFDQTLDVAITTDTNTAPTGVLSLAGSYVDTSEMGTKKGVTTGHKLVGDKAHGTITIYSSSDARTFLAGTAVSANGLRFVTTSDVSLASASGIASQATANVSITASDIGDNYNLPSGSLFAIASLPTSSFQGKNDNPLTGGNSHQAAVVTKEDQDRLMSTLSAELSSQAENDLANKVPSGMTLLQNAITSTVAKKQFSGDVDSPGDTVSLDLTLNFHGVYFSKDEALTLFKNNFASAIPSGYSLSSDQSEINVVKSSLAKNGTMILSLEVKSNLVPQIASAALPGELAGKIPDTGRKALLALPGVTSVVFESQPAFLSPLTKIFLPWNKNNIRVSLVTESGGGS